jgi:flagellar assembly protein FliH
VSNLRAEVALRAERDLIRLAVEIAKKIIHREVTVDGEIALTLARVALSRVHNRAVATVRLHPDDHAYISTRVARLEGHGSLELVADASIGRGGCLVQAEMGDVDARIEQQFAEIERSFFGG